MRIAKGTLFFFLQKESYAENVFCKKKRPRVVVGGGIRPGSEVDYKKGGTKQSLCRCIFFFSPHRKVAASLVFIVRLKGPERT